MENYQIYHTNYTKNNNKQLLVDIINLNLESSISYIRKNAEHTHTLSLSLSKSKTLNTEIK